MSESKPRLRVEVELRVVDNETNQVVDVKGYADMRSVKGGKGTFFPLQTVTPMTTFDDPAEALAYMNTMWAIIDKIKELP